MILITSTIPFPFDDVSSVGPDLWFALEVAASPESAAVGET
jgi:hypothetical protein